MIKPQVGFCTNATLLSLLQNDDDDDTNSSPSKLTTSAAEAVKKNHGGLAAMLVRHMMHAMQLGGPSGIDKLIWHMLLA